MPTPSPTPLPASLAVAQRSLGDPNHSYPLFPPLLEGCPATSTAELQYPLALDYDSVSYTHLDVYKRQSASRATAR